MHDIIGTLYSDVPMMLGTLGKKGYKKGQTQGPGHFGLLLGSSFNIFWLLLLAFDLFNLVQGAKFRLQRGMGLALWS